MPPPHRPDPLAAAAAILTAAALVVILVLLAPGCSMDRAVHAANVSRSVGHAAAEVLAEVCTAGYERAQTREDVERLDDLGCPDAAHALDTYRGAHGLMVATLHAIDAGRCNTLSPSPRSCDLTGAGVALARAGAELAAAIDRLRPPGGGGGGGAPPAELDGAHGGAP